jgi:hypothetical protein
MPSSSTSHKPCICTNHELCAESHGKVLSPTTTHTHPLGFKSLVARWAGSSKGHQGLSPEPVMTGARPPGTKVVASAAVMVTMVFTTGVAFHWSICEVFQPARLPWWHSYHSRQPGTREGSDSYLMAKWLLHDSFDHLKKKNIKGCSQ